MIKFMAVTKMDMPLLGLMNKVRENPEEMSAQQVMNKIQELK